MKSANEKIAAFSDIPPGRDHPDVGSTLADFELFSPGTRAVYEAYDELLLYYEKPSGIQLLQMNRVAAVEAVLALH